MRISNRILNSNAGIYSYNEADEYRLIVDPPPEEFLILIQVK